MDSPQNQNMKPDVKVLIKYLVTLSDRTARSEEEVRFPRGSVLKDVAEWLNKRYSLSLPNPNILTILNGRGWEQFPLKLSNEIKDGDIICLLPPIYGG